jgi:hypothetical protein
VPYSIFSPSDLHSIDAMASQADKSSDTASAEKQDVNSPVAKPGPQAVPRSQRRGLLGSVTIIPEVVNPYEYKNGTKWLMTAIVSMAACTSSFGSSVFYREYPTTARTRRFDSAWKNRTDTVKRP